MNRLLLNEFKKVGLKKIIIYDLLLFITISIIFYFNKNKESFIAFDTIYTIIPFLGILICIIFGGVISSEVSSGTFKVYLTKGYCRWKILISKLIFIYLYIIHLFIFTIIIYTIFMKVFYTFNLSLNLVVYVFKHFVPLFFVGTLCLFLSTIINNVALCVGVSIIICLLSSVIAQILFAFNINLVEYSFLPYIDFNVLRDSNYLYELEKYYGVTLSINKGIIILVFHIILFLSLAINIFTKKDIKN